MVNTVRSSGCEGEFPWGGMSEISFSVHAELEVSVSSFLDYLVQGLYQMLFLEHLTIIASFS